jgi:tripartite-type tricarboxylate transporter receptor subunit TctC
MISKRSTLRTLATAIRIATLAALPLLSLPALAQASGPYPNRPIRLVVPLGAGSAVDVAARIVVQKMGQNMGQPIVVENIVGASGIVGTDKVAKAAPDGYTLGGFNDSIMTMVPALQPKLPWDILRDFTPVSLVATIEWCLVGHPSAPFDTAAAFIKAAQAAPGKVDYGSGGIGSPQHIAMALFANDAGIQLNHVPYKGASDLATGLAGAQVPIAFQGLASVNPLVKGKRLKLLAVGTPKRMPQYPDVPTVSESGLPGWEFNSWFTLMAPAGTPAEVVARLNAEVQKALADPAVREQLVAQGLTPRGSSADELATATKSQLAKYAALIKKAGIKAE